jgi:hypothetical protein
MGGPPPLARVAYPGWLGQPLGSGTPAAAPAPEPAPPPPPPAPLTTAGLGLGTAADYTIGPPTRPPIHHDNGFLQNPADPSDPNPIPTVEPSFSDRLSLAEWKLKLEAAEAIQGVPLLPHNDIPDGLAAYRAFLEGGGADRTFSYERYLQNDASGATTLNNATRDTQLGAQALYQQMLARDPSLAGRSVSFDMTGGAIGAGASPDFPYPDTENWQKAIGGHTIWTSASVTVTPPASPGDPPTFTMTMAVHAEDRYNFNPGAQDIASGTPDAANGRFEQTGLAHQYTNTGSASREVSWAQGHEASATSRPTDDSRQREPDDNRRARNRT